jgi:hypothetical protein
VPAITTAAKPNTSGNHGEEIATETNTDRAPEASHHH